MARKFLNNYSTSITAQIFGADVSVNVAEAPPALAAGDYYVMTLTDHITSPTVTEHVKVTAVSGNTLTIERGFENTTPSQFFIGAVIELRATADSFARLDGTEITRYVETTKLDATNVVDRADGGLQMHTLTNHTTMSFVLEEGESIMLHLINWSQWTVSWSGVTWIGGGAPSTVTDQDILNVYKFNGITFIAYVGWY